MSNRCNNCGYTDWVEVKPVPSHWDGGLDYACFPCMNILGADEQVKRVRKAQVNSGAVMKEFNQGVRACRANTSIRENPYPTSSQKYDDWHAGYQCQLDWDQDEE